MRGRWEKKLVFRTDGPDYADMAYPFVGRLEFLRAAHELLNIFLGKPWEEFGCALACLRLAAAAYDVVWRP